MASRRGHKLALLANLSPAQGPSKHSPDNSRSSALACWTCLPLA